MTGPTLDLWVIYREPRDFPGVPFVVRKQSVCPDLPGRILVDRIAQPAQTLLEARAKVPPGLFCIPRDPTDDSVIVETWL